MNASRAWSVRNAPTRTGKGALCRVETLGAFVDRPMGLLLRYIVRHALSHALVLLSVVLAVACALASQYAIKNLIDSLGTARSHPWLIERAFPVLVVLIFADNLFRRAGGWVAARAFVAITGDIRQDLFGYLVGHTATYFSDKQPGMLSSRVSATANAVYTAENTVTWNALPPCLAVVGAIAIISTVDPGMAAALVTVSLVLASALFRLAHRGRVVDDGSPADLAFRPGIYRDVLARQVRHIAPQSREFAEVSTESRRKPKWPNESGEKK